MQHATRRIGLAASILTFLTCTAAARAGLEVHFTGPVTSFSDTLTQRLTDGTIVDTPGITTIVPGSTFDGSVFWADNGPTFSPHFDVFFPIPVTEFTVDGTSSFSSEMLGIGGSHGGYGVAVSTVGIPGDEDVLFGAGHAGLIGPGISAELDILTASDRLLSHPQGEPAWLIGQDLTSFLSGTFFFGFDTFGFAPGRLAPGQVERHVELEGTVTSLVVVSPEPSPLIAASLGGLLGVGLAWRRRKARLAS